MQSRSSEQGDFAAEDEMSFPEVNSLFLELDTTLYEISVRDSNSGQTLLKTVSRGRYRRDNVIMMQVSGTCSPRIKQRLFRHHLRYCTTAHHFNVARFVGGTNPSASENYPFVLLREGPGVDHETFLQSNYSMKALMEFLKGVQKGTRFIFDQGIKHRDCIQVLPSGEAIVYPSGILMSKFSGYNSTKRAARHLLRDAPRSGAVLPLHAIYELLSAASTSSQQNALEAALLRASLITEHTLWRIADSLNLPITRELHYLGPEPNFTLVAGDVGRPDLAVLVEDMIRSSARITIHGWSKASRLSIPRDETAENSHDGWQQQLSSRAMRPEAVTPYFLDCDFPLSSESRIGWHRYDHVLQKAEGSDVNMCLLYATKSHIRSSPPRAENDMTTASTDPLFTVQSVVVRLRFFIPAPAQLPQPIYFHRRLHADVSTREFWGFISDKADPLATPSRQVEDLALKYDIHIRTTMQNDSWSGRADACLSAGLAKLPGSFVA
ncbi:hypothetical protein BDV93DRAFT_528319 [Ceratobasidium sp. AG-I]|nr:hypothetical protein BDV93DRAFT_528319 [Ceratobasidium sp. AG-I]